MTTHRPRFDREESILRDIQHLSSMCDSDRQERLRSVAARVPDHRFSAELARIRELFVTDRQKRFSERTSAFTPFSGDDLAVLEAQLVRYMLDKRYGNLGTNGELMNTLRANRIAQSPVVNGKLFREISAELLRRNLVCICDFFEFEEFRFDNVAVILPLRAGLAGAIPYFESGVRNFGLIGIGRNEKTAEADIRYYARPPVIMKSTKLFLISDPMIATGGSLEATIDWLKDLGVPEQKIGIQSYVAAPEGLDYLLSKYDIRVITLIQDGCLDKNAYITDVGIGDFGDHFMRDITRTEMRELWVKPGILTEEEIAAVEARTAEIQAV